MGYGGRVHVWDARCGREVLAQGGPPEGVCSLCFSPDGGRLAVTNWQGRQVKVFDWTGDKLTEVRTLRHPWFTGAVAYSPDGKFLASSDLTGLKLWNARTHEEVWAVEAEAHQLAFAPDGRVLFAATTDDQPKAVHTFTRWEVETWKELPPLGVQVSVEPARAFHRLSCDGKALFVVPQHGGTYVREIDIAAGKELFPRRGHGTPLRAVAVSPDGRTVASAGDDWVVKLWDLATARVVHSMSTHHGAVSGLAFSPDGRLLASASRDGTVALWDVASGTEVRALRRHARSPSRLQFSPDGRSLAAGGAGGVVKVWEVATGREGRPLPGHAGTVRCVAFSPDGKALASGREDGTVRLHDLAAGNSRRLRGPAR